MRFEYIDIDGNRDSEFLTASIDIYAWPNEMFPLNQLTVCFASFVSSMSLCLSVVSASASDAIMP